MSSQEHVLISQGYCAARALSVPSPYFFQELLRKFWLDTEETDQTIPFIFSNIILSVELHPWDSYFIWDICGDQGCWWHLDGDVATFDLLNGLFWKRMNKV